MMTPMSKMPKSPRKVPMMKTPSPAMKAKLTPVIAAKIRAKANRMMGGMAVLLLCLLALPIHAAVQTIQVTVGASTTQLSPTTLYCNWVVFQNNATHAMRIGDPNTTSARGISISPGGGSFYQGVQPYGNATNLFNWWVNGTAGDVIDVVCDVVVK